MAFAGSTCARRFIPTAVGMLLPLGPERLIINPGSVGQPRDSDPRAAYALLDTEAMTWFYQRVPYPVRDVQERMEKYGMPKRLVNRLAYGV